MFLFVIKYLGFLKSVPLLALVFDSLLRLITFVTKPSVLNYIDELETRVKQWDGISTGLHKYGGLQFNYLSKELGHIHSNGLLDMLLNKQTKDKLMAQGRITDHHSFKNTGWISFYVKTENDKSYALHLLDLAYQSRKQKGTNVNFI